MTPEQEAELIEKMARNICRDVHIAAHPTGWRAGELESKIDAYWKFWEPTASAALRLAEPVIRDAALDEAEELIERAGDQSGTSIWCKAASAIRSLKSTNSPAPQETK